MAARQLAPTSSQVDNDSFTWQAIDRTVDGEMQPNIDEVLIVRKPTE
jgi:hypothetical protein